MKHILAILLLSVFLPSSAQRYMEKLDRALVAVPSQTSGMFISWRILAEEYHDVTYNLYCDGEKIADNLTVSCYTHTSGTFSCKYQVAAVIGGAEQKLCEPVTPWQDGSLTIPLQPVISRDGKDVTALYSTGRVTLGDLTGDGQMEFIVRRNCMSTDSTAHTSVFNLFEAYDRYGNRLWQIDLGPNVMAEEKTECICYDWDKDGKAEILIGLKEGAVIHGEPNIVKCPLQCLDKETAENRIYYAAPYLDGENASILVAHKHGNRITVKAFYTDSATSEITELWSWENIVPKEWDCPNIQIADTDLDGRDEIILGSIILDDDGPLITDTFRSTNAQHCEDFNPYHKYPEILLSGTNPSSLTLRNAFTSAEYYSTTTADDDNNAMCANFTDNIPGCVARSVSTDWTGSCSGKAIPELGGDSFVSWSHLTNRIYWDGDLCDEYFGSTKTEGQGVIYKPADTGRWNLADTKCIGSHNNPCAIADILGDWREEIIMRKADNSAIVIFTTPIATTFRIPSLLTDHQYRNSIVCQSVGDGITPHKSYFLGKSEGITQAPPPLTINGRKKIENTETITTTDDHLLISGYHDTTLNIEDGASPRIVTFNIPCLTDTYGQGSPSYIYPYYCEVSGGAFSGNTRIVKQGEGVLHLPDTDMKHTGDTDIWGGTLSFDGSMKSSPLHLGRFTRLITDGGTFHNIKAEYGSVIIPGDKETASKITADTLSLGFGSRILLDLSNDSSNSDKLNAKCIRVERKTSDAWKSYGPEYLQPVIEIAEHPEKGETCLPDGNYIIGNVQSTEGLLSDIRIEGITDRKTSLSIDANHNLVLTLGKMRDKSDITWTGVISPVWDNARTKNFTLSGSNEATAFLEGDNVHFTDASEQTNITADEVIIADEITVSSSKDYVISGKGSLSGSTLTKNGNGSLTLDAGKLTLDRISLEAGTLNDAGSGICNIPIYIPEGKNGTLILGAKNYTCYEASLTGGGSLTVIPTNTVSRVRISADWSKFTGTVRHTTPSIWLPLDTDNGLPYGTLDVAQGCTVTNTGKPFTIGKLTGSGSLAQPISSFQDSDPVRGNNTWIIGNSDTSLGDFTFDGTIDDTGGTNKAAFTKTGSCTMTITGKWTNSGAVSIKEGELHISPSANLGTGALTVAAEATLSGESGNGSHLSNQSVTVSGTLQAGATSTSVSGHLDFGGQNVSFSGSANLVLGIKSANSGNELSGAGLTGIGKLKFSSGTTISLFFDKSYQPLPGDTLRLFTNTGSITGYPDVICNDSGIIIDSSNLQDGYVTISPDSPNLIDITGFSQDMTAKIDVVSLSGNIISSFSCNIRDIESQFRQNVKTRGIYILRINGKTTMKVIRNK